MKADVKGRHCMRRLRASGVAVLVLATALTTTAAAAGSARANGFPLPLKFTDCTGQWVKMYAPREGLEAAVPDRYEVWAGHRDGTPLAPMDEPANAAFGNLSVETEQCTAEKSGEQISFSIVSVQVRRPSEADEIEPVHPPEDKPGGTHSGDYYLLAFVVPEGESANQLRTYLADKGLPVFAGSVKTLFDEMGAAPTGYATHRSQVSVEDGLAYAVTGVASNAVFAPMHEHITSYYFDSAGGDGRVRPMRMVVDVLMEDWPAACTAEAGSDEMAALMGGGLNAGQSWCFLNGGPEVRIGAAKLH